MRGLKAKFKRPRKRIRLESLKRKYKHLHISCPDKTNDRKFSNTLPMTHFGFTIFYWRLKTIACHGIHKYACMKTFCQQNIFLLRLSIILFGLKLTLGQLLKQILNLKVLNAIQNGIQMLAYKTIHGLLTILHILNTLNTIVVPVFKSIFKTDFQCCVFSTYVYAQSAKNTYRYM